MSEEALFAFDTLVEKYIPASLGNRTDVDIRIGNVIIMFFINISQIFNEIFHYFDPELYEHLKSIDYQITAFALSTCM